VFLIHAVRLVKMISHVTVHNHARLAWDETCVVGVFHDVAGMLFSTMLQWKNASKCFWPMVYV